MTPGQLSLDDVPTGPTARTDDLETAKAAGAAQTPERLSAGRRKVLMALSHYRGLTDFDHERISGMIQTSAGKRRVELQRAGLVEQVPGEYGISPSGSRVAMWRLTHEGRNLAVRLDMETSLDG